jgi:SWI/SNF related-matrix-associated actin-dependent regulator of chromatin subfamily C
VDADARPSNVGPPFTGHFRVIADTPRGLQPWNPSTDPIIIQGKANADTESKAKGGSTSTKLERNLEIGRNAYEPNGKEIVSATVKPTEKHANGESATISNGTADPSIKALDDSLKGPEEKINCFTCGIDCTRVYYHNGKSDKGATGAAAKVKYNVCPNCFIQHRIPANHHTDLYVKMENPSYSTLPDRDAPWTDEEVLLLLEGLEKFDESWADIAAYVGTRTREECVVKFLQLEIEDKYLDSEPVPNSTMGMGLLSGQGHIPFSQADNPVLSVVGFLAGLTDPSVTAAAAGKSVEEMKRSLREKLEKPSDSQAVSEKGKEKDSGDMMEIDIRHETTTVTTTTTTSNSLATIPLAIAAARAGSLATHEEREMTRLVSAAVNVTLQKFELKLQQFNEMELILQAERRELERGRQQLFLDRLAFKKRVRDVQEGLKMAAATGGEQGIKMAQDVMSANEKLTFNSNMTGADSVLPLSAEGPVKTYEI